MNLIERATERAKVKPQPHGPAKSVAHEDDLDAWTEDQGRDVRRAPNPEDRAEREEASPVRDARAPGGDGPIMSRLLAATESPRQRGALKSPGLSRAEPEPAERKSREFEINFERLRKFGFITPSDRRSRVSEEFRLIKRRLMQRMSLGAKKAGAKRQRGRQHVILITSARPSEGKSFIAVNLALSIVLDEGFNVMLVDGDVARPSLGRIFGLREDLPGLTDLLLGDSSALSKVMLREKNLPFSLLAAGGAVASATDLFGGDQMRRMVSDLATRYDDRIIIFDAPPLLASTEPVALAEHAGQVVLAIDAERTSRAAVDSALDLLETDQNVNLVLNKTTVRNRTEQFGSYYEAYNQHSS